MEETRGQGVPLCVAGEGSGIRTDLVCCLCFLRFRSAPQKWGALVGQVLLQPLSGNSQLPEPTSPEGVFAPPLAPPGAG